MPKILSGKVAKVPSTQVSAERHEFITLGETEPDLGVPTADGQVVASTTAGVRSWVPAGVLVGGNQDEVLTKNSNTNYDAAWAKPKPITYTFTQNLSNQYVWTINHNLGFFPSVVIKDTAGTASYEAEVTYTDVNTLELHFDTPILGIAQLS